MTSGDEIAGRLRAAGIAGAVEAVRETPIDGPLPVGSGDADWQRVRGAWLADRYGLDRAACVEEQERLTGLLDQATRASSLVLWFDDDLMCQRTMLMLVHRLIARSDMSGVEVRVASLAGDDDVAAALARARAWETDGLVRAASAWLAIAGHDAAGVARAGADAAAAGDESLAAALALDLRWRMVRVRAGAEIERLVGEDAITFGELEQRWQRSHAQFGLGDWQIWLLAAAAVQRVGLTLTGARGDASALHDGSFRAATFGPRAA